MQHPSFILRVAKAVEGTSRRTLYWTFDHRPLWCMKEAGCKAVRVQVELSGKGLHINSPDRCFWLLVHLQKLPQMGLAGKRQQPILVECIILLVFSRATSLGTGWSSCWRSGIACWSRLPWCPPCPHLPLLLIFVKTKAATTTITAWACASAILKSAILVRPRKYHRLHFFIEYSAPCILFPLQLLFILVSLVHA